MKKEIKKHIESISNIVSTSKVYKFGFNITELPPHENFTVDIREQGRFKELFTELNKKTNYCLYWFTCEDNSQAAELIGYLNLQRPNLKGQRTVPVPNSNTDSNVLYVGVRQGGATKKGFSHLAGRIVQHLGYYKHGSTGALHLLQWAAGKNVNLTLNVMDIGKPVHQQYLYIIEKLAAISLRPLCGKH